MTGFVKAFSRVQLCLSSSYCMNLAVGQHACDNNWEKGHMFYMYTQCVGVLDLEILVDTEVIATYLISDAAEDEWRTA